MYIERYLITESLKNIGNRLLKDKYKIKWSEDNPTYGYCYIVSECIYHYSNNENLIPMCMNLGKEIGTHWYLKDKETNDIIDFTGEQFDFEIDYNKGIGKGFMKGSVKTEKGYISKRGYELASIIGIVK